MLHLSIKGTDAAPRAPSADFPLPGWPLFRLGFRPFYLGAAAFALYAVPYWIAGLLGWVTLPTTMPPLFWHAHEMLFGFAMAVIVGFLLTAGKAWTGLATPRGATLAAMAGLWLAARLAALGLPYAVYALLDMALLPWVAWVLARVLLKAGNRRNLPLVVILLLMATANLMFHAAVLGWLRVDPLRALHAGLALIVMIECVIAGRVIPAFTMSALPGRQLKVPAGLERSTLAVTVASLAAWVLLPAHPATAVGLALAALLHLARLWHWQPWRTRARPILWVLHAAYAWLPVGFGLLAWAQVGGVAASVGIHALAVGATAGLIIGMVTRTARGHTGRALKVSRLEVAAYLLVASAAVARVLLPTLAPAHTTSWLVLAASTWAIAFALYLWVFTPWLLSSRLDGKDG
ncbi:MAG: NnrS family protein [Rubrivivax sp.]|nr:NnrS family protein [Rubrivivax sp.]